MPRKAKPKVKAASRASTSATKSKGKSASMAASRLIDERLRSWGGWRAETLREVRRLIHEADPDVVEECKWIKPTNPLGVPVWSHAGMVCTGEAYSKVVKLTFFRGASIPDPARLFNASLDGNTRRAIDVREGQTIDADAFMALVKAAVVLNGASEEER